MPFEDITISLTARECGHILASLRCFMSLCKQPLGRPEMILRTFGNALEIAKAHGPLLSVNHLNNLCERFDQSAKIASEGNSTELDHFIGIAVDSEEGGFSIDFLVANNVEEADELLKKMRPYSPDCEVYSLNDWAHVAQKCKQNSIKEILARMKQLTDTYSENSCFAAYKN